jgi:hypothetical protein
VPISAFDEPDQPGWTFIQFHDVVGHHILRAAVVVELDALFGLALKQLRIAQQPIDSLAAIPPIGAATLLAYKLKVGALLGPTSCW